MDLQKFVQLVQQNNGATFNFNTEELNPKTGFMVSLQGLEEVIPLQDFNVERLKGFVRKNVDLLLDINNSTTFLGCWIEKGKVYIDISLKIQDKRQALRTGLLNQQLAIFDCSTQNVINLPTVQKTGTETQKRAYINQVLNSLCPIKYVHLQ